MLQINPIVILSRYKSRQPSKLKYQLAIPGFGLEDRGFGARDSKKFEGPLPFKLAPIKVGDKYDVRIESMSRRGDSGVAKIQGLVVFVSGAKVGDFPTIKVTKIGKGFATGDIIAKSDMTAAGGEAGAGAETKASDAANE